MTTRLLVIGTDEKRAISDLIRKATEDRVSYTTMLELVQKCERGEADPTGNRDKKITLPHGYHVVFTIEEHAPNAPMRHISISVDAAPGLLPSPYAVAAIMQEFEFINNLENCIVGLEAIGGGFQAVNVLEPLNGDWTPFRGTVPQVKH